MLWLHRRKWLKVVPHGCNIELEGKKVKKYVLFLWLWTNFFQDCSCHYTDIGNCFCRLKNLRISFFVNRLVKWVNRRTIIQTHPIYLTVFLYFDLETFVYTKLEKYKTFTRDPWGSGVLYSELKCCKFFNHYLKHS